VITLDEKKKRMSLAFAGVVFVFTGFQFYRFLTVDGSILQAMSIMISIALIVMLLKLSKTVNESEISTCRQRVDGNALYEGSTMASMPRSNEIAEYMANIKDELGQAEQLVNDAVTNLVVNFGYISELTNSQRDMVLTVEKLAMSDDNAEVVKLLRRQMMMAKKIEQELATTVTSMQFGDLVVQLLKHTESQINTLDSVLQRIDQQNTQERNIYQADDECNEISSATIKMKKINQTRPVLQQGLQSGEVDLF
jgi:hypothetical protein